MYNLSKIFFVAILLAIVSCNNQEKIVKQYSYFDLAGFFEKEAVKLQTANPLVLKSVEKDDVANSRSLKISNWKNELELFSSSDINKPAWKKSYITKKTAGYIEYISTDPKLRTQRILIEKDRKGKIKHIAISNKVSNDLYSSIEKLNYYTDSLYQISKEQKVKLLGENQYFIRGQINYSSEK